MSENLQNLQELVQIPAAVRWFDGLFRVARLAVTDTGEEFTLTHNGSSVAVTEGFDDHKPNFVLPLESQNIRNLLGFFEAGEIGEYEEYRIVKFMLRPCLEAALAMPILQNPLFLKVVKVDTLWHEALLDNEGREDEQLTVSWDENRWTVTPGYHGEAQRHVVITPKQGLEFQRHIFEADAQNSIPKWLETAKWYANFREQITVAPAA